MPGEPCTVSVFEYNVYIPQDYFLTFIFSFLYTNYLLLAIIVFQLYLFVLESGTLYMKVISITVSAFVFVSFSGPVNPADLGLCECNESGAGGSSPSSLAVHGDIPHGHTLIASAKYLTNACHWSEMRL